MKHSKDPFEAAIEEQEESPPESPGGGDGTEDGRTEIERTREEDERAAKRCKTSVVAEASNKKDENEDEEEEEENVEVEFTKYTASANPVKIGKMQTILSQFTEDQMSRYESFRRSALHKSNMKKLLQSITGQKIGDTMNIVVCGIAKMFVGELVETARVDMGKRKESGPIRPCHIRESYRRLKLQGKVPKRSLPRLFR